MKLRGLSRFVDILASIIGVLSICYFLLNPKLDWWVWDVNPDLVVSGVAGGLGALYLFGAISRQLSVILSCGQLEYTYILSRYYCC
jgi:hypothetical protein